MSDSRYQSPQPRRSTRAIKAGEAKPPVRRAKLPAAPSAPRHNWRLRRWLLIAVLVGLFALPVGVFLLGWAAQPVVLPLHRTTTGVALAFSPDGDTLVGGCRGRYPGEGTLEVWDVKTSRQRLRISLELKEGANSVAFSPDGDLLAIACGGYDRRQSPGEDEVGAEPGHVCVYDPKTWERVATLPHAHGVYAVAFSPDGKLLAAAGGKKVRGRRDSVAEAHVWDVQTWQKVATLDGLTYRVEALAFSPDGQTLAVGDGNERVILFTSSGRLRDSMPNQMGTVTSLAFCHDERLVVGIETDHEKGHVLLWDLKRERVTPWPAQAERISNPSACCMGRDGKTLVISNDGERVGGCGNFDPAPGRIVAWDVSSGSKLTAWEEPAGSTFSSLAISPDGKWLAVGVIKYERNHVKIRTMPKR